MASAAQQMERNRWHVVPKLLRYVNMVDIKSKKPKRAEADEREDVLALPAEAFEIPGDPDRRGFAEEELRQAIELMFFAYRDMTKGPDEMLATMGLGRAHHRVVHFIGRNPGITVAALLDRKSTRLNSSH